MIVTDVDPNGPAARAGINPNDVIVSADNRQLTDESELYRILQGHKPGDRMSLVVARGDQAPQTVTVTLGTAPA